MWYKNKNISPYQSVGISSKVVGGWEHQNDIAYTTIALHQKVLVLHNIWHGPDRTLHSGSEINKPIKQQDLPFDQTLLEASGHFY